MPCNRIVWEVWSSSVVKSIQLSPLWMWGQLRRFLLAGRHNESYLTTGNNEDDDGEEDGSKDPISFQVQYGRMDVK